MGKKWFSFLFFLAVFFFYLLPPIDTDLGWHWRYGQHLVETGSIWRQNEIGFWLTDYPWAHSYTLHQIITYLGWEKFGFQGLMILTGLIMVGCFFFLSQVSFPLDTLAFLGGSLFFVSLSWLVVNLGYRSQLYTLLGMSFLFFFLDRSLKWSWFQWVVLFLVFSFWANLHGGFILALVGLFFYFLVLLVKREKEKAVWVLGGILIALIGSLINPFGWRIYPEIFRHSWYPLNRLIAEWTPPHPKQLVLVFLSGGISLAFFFKEGKRVKKDSYFLFLTIIWLFFFFLAFRARRHLPFLALASLVFWRRLIPAEFWFPLRKKGRWVFGFLFLIVIGWRLISWPRFSSGEEAVCQLSRWRLPCQAVVYLQKRPAICQRIFNAYEWGGYLAWHLPERKIFVDGRMPAWPTPEGKSPYLVYLEILQARKGFEEKLGRYQPDCLLIARGTFLDLELKRNPRNWEKIYQDEVAVIYLKREN